MTGKGKPTMKAQTITVKRDEAQPESVELLADAIIKCADGLEKLRSGPLSQRAIVVLLHDLTKVGIPHIRAIIDAAPNLRKMVKR